MYRVALSQSCSNGRTETRVVPTSADAPLDSKGASRTGPARPDLLVYSLYTKINAFWITHNNRTVQNDFCALFSFLHGTGFLLSLYLYKICRSARSTRVDRSRSCFTPQTSFSSLLLFLFFGTIFEMHSQLFSANLFALASRRAPGSRKITRRGSNTLASLPSVVKASSFYVRMLFIFALSLSLSLFLYYSIFYFLGDFCLSFFRIGFF